MKSSFAFLIPTIILLIAACNSTESNEKKLEPTTKEELGELIIMIHLQPL